MRPEAAARDRWLAAVGSIPGTLVYRSEVLRGMGHALSLPVGHPDCVWHGCGLAVGIEWKAPGGRLSPAQMTFRRSLEAAGGHWILARDPAQVCRALAAMVQGPVAAALLAVAEKMQDGAK